MDIPDKETYTIKSSVGSFRVEKDISRQYNGSYNCDLLKVGGKNFCITFSFKRQNTFAELQWLLTDKGGCELTNIAIKGKYTVHLFHLSINILKTYLPSLTHIELLDNSKFSCIMPNNKIQTIQLNYYYYLLKGSTFYDNKFGAYPKDPIERERYIYNKNLYPTKIITESFDFINDDLQNMFGPLLSSSTTWKEFIDKLSNKLNNKLNNKLPIMPSLCQYLQVWYYKASLILTGGISLPSYWIIDTFKTISYEKITFAKGGFAKKTRSNKKYKSMESIIYSDFSHDDICSLRFI